MDYTDLNEKLKGYSDKEFIQYINENAKGVTLEVFLLIKKETQKRKFIANDLAALINRVQGFRNRELIDNIYSNIYNSKKIKSAADVVIYLKENEIPIETINNLLISLPETISKITEHSNKESSDAILWLIGGIIISLGSFAVSPYGGGIVTIGAIYYGFSKGFGGRNNPKMEKLKISIDEYLIEHKLTEIIDQEPLIFNKL